MHFSFLVISLLLGSCSHTPHLSQSGTNIELVSEIDQKNCKNLGPVFGKGGGWFNGAWIADENLMMYASIDLRNKAAGLGATHVVTQTHQMGQPRTL
jgi:hypothetical protein